MRRRAVLPLALALAHAACTSAGEPAREGREPPLAETRQPAVPGPEAPSPGRELAGGTPGRSYCGAIEVEPLEAWQHEGPRLDELRRRWHPRPEHGWPVAIREARPPVEVPGQRLWEVYVSGAARAIRPCFMVDAAPRPGTPVLPRTFDTCTPAWALVAGATPEARPMTAEQWAALLGLLDGAAAVYPDAQALERCVPGMPEEVRAAVPPLGLRRSGSALDVAFVERVDVGGMAMLVAAEASLEHGRLVLEHRELWTFDREVGR